MRRTLALGIAVIAAGGCGRCSDRAGDTPARDPACASACAALVTAGCDRPGLEPAAAARCVEACAEAGVELAAARCQSEREAYLGCVSTAKIDCQRASSTAAVCIEHYLGIVGCDAEHERYRRCVAPCLHAGAEHVGPQVETTRLGCGACPELEKGAPPGSPCQAPKVCAERCCTCPDGRVRYATRVCEQGACVGEAACARARALGPDPCTAQER